MSVTIWHNPRCSKSRETLALLQARGLDPEVRLFLEDTPSEADIRDALAKLEVMPIAMMRTKEAEFKAANLSKDSDADRLIAAMVATPKLIERPIVFAKNSARIGRPPESVLDIVQRIKG